MHFFSASSVISFTSFSIYSTVLSLINLYSFSILASSVSSLEVVVLAWVFNFSSTFAFKVVQAYNFSYWPSFPVNYVIFYAQSYWYAFNSMVSFSVNVSLLVNFSTSVVV